MVDGLDMTLDDIINKNQRARASFRAAGGGGRLGRGHGGAGRASHMTSGPGPTRPTSVIGSYRTAPYPPPPKKLIRGHWMPETGIVGEGPSNAAAATMVYVSNLDYGVTQEDIEILFADIGEMKRHAIHYDHRGRSLGTAEVVFVRHSDALKAIERYNDLRLDGRPIKIEIVGADFVPCSSTLPRPNDGSLGYQRGAFRSNNRDGFKQGGGHGHVHEAQGRKRDRAEKVSVEALDADLDKYHQDAFLH